MSCEHHLAGPCDGISFRREGTSTTINFRSEDEARAFDYALCEALYAASAAAIRTPTEGSADA